MLEVAGNTLSDRETRALGNGRKTSDYDSRVRLGRALDWLGRYSVVALKTCACACTCTCTCDRQKVCVCGGAEGRGRAKKDV